ncbi:MAG: translation factor (SUA5) [Actinobacteria bacterium]|uniref:L-threonylcarbamoyladenylate synthase n=1 Tax=freshwater metagenome TaxID=449393 RepID=A0A6J6Q4E2_9ZZZZ|nr:translation factor (SUA5) [Actinomycetota bacterium]MSY16204.1 translation factor (SUA5) [Actinomycetota bacterium]
MAQRIDLTSEDLAIAVETAVRNITAGEVIVVPSEFGYIYLCDAFAQDAVKALHILRGDGEAVAAQVFIKDPTVLTGLVKSVSDDIKVLTEKFWPGGLSITFNANPGLSWNLGDGGRLGKVNIRIPNHNFLLEILKNTGPLATASAALTGKVATLDLTQLPIYESDIGVIFSAGILTSPGKSTVIDATGSQLKIKRIGVISENEIRAVIPNLLV